MAAECSTSQSMYRFQIRDMKRETEKEKMPLVDKCAKCRFNCRANFSEERRLLLCRDCFGLANAVRQKTFIVSMVVEKEVGLQRSRKHVDVRKKGKSCEYYLVWNSEKKRVCQSFLCSTFAISNCVVYAALKGKGEAGICTKQDGRIGRPAPNKTEDDRVKHVYDHINSFPRVKPHYCRPDSTMQYLSPELNGAQMYRLYKQYCQENDISNPVKEHKYRDIFLSDFRLKCFCPKKDQCTVCNAYCATMGDEKEMLRESWEEHKSIEKEAVVK